MSRSFKHNTFARWCGGSNKKDRSAANKRFRTLCKRAIQSDNEPPVNLREVSNTYEFNSDGLAHYIDKQTYSEIMGILRGFSDEYINNSWRKMMSK